MKVLAFLLLFANLAVWMVADYMAPPMRSLVPAGGKLPRVASLKLTPDPVDPASPVAEATACISVGWFGSREAAQALLRRIPGLDIAAVDIVPVERVSEPLNWVIIPPQPEQEALRQFRAIQRQGIDSFLVTQGQYRNAISLGLFESREAALTLLEEKKRQNLNAVLVKYTRNQISYALNIRAGHHRVDAVISSLRAEFGREFDFVKVNSCKGVASAEKNP